MNEATIAAAQALQLPDTVFHSASKEVFDAIAATIAPKHELPGPGDAADATVVPPIFALGLPRIVEPDQDTIIPGALLLRYTGLRRWQVNFNQNLSFIVVDLRSGAMETVNPFQLDKLMVMPPPSRSGPQPNEVNRNAISYGVERFKLPPVFGDDWPSTAFAVTAIAYDWITNTAVVERKPPPHFDWKPFRSPSDFIDGAPPPVAGEPGITLALPAQVPAGGPIPISGRLLVPRDAVTLAHSTEDADGLVMVAVLYLARLDVMHPIRLALGIPVSVQGDTVSAAFSFDLAARPEAADLAGEYQVYFVSGRSVAGPAALTVSPH